MTTAFVLDASAVVKTFLDQAGSDDVRAWLQTAVTAGHRLLAPDLLDYELGSVVAREFADLEPGEQAFLLDLALRHVVRSRPLLVEALDLARRHRITAYDAAYLALALAQGASLVTSDRILGEAAAAEGAAVVKL